ncbi:FkbM family methyltransferase [Paenibacillus pabuli]|uniref:FkbM family methyltransferase n=1 Tax=Paenibacillus pabuli TaxID=1472 RepID=UPI003CF4BF12
MIARNKATNREEHIINKLLEKNFIQAKDELARFSEMLEIIRGIIKEDIKSIEVTKEKTVIHLADGRMYNLNPDRMDIIVYLLKAGTIEPDETAFIGRFLKPGDIVFDIGANAGWFSILFSQLVGSQGEVHAFEPLPDAVHSLMENMELNKCFNMYIHPFAVSKENGKGNIFIPANQLSTQSSLSFDSIVGKGMKMPCDIISLDTFVKERRFTKIDFIKIDAEGFEIEVLKGSTTLLETFKPVLMVECLTEQAFLQLKELLEPKGYRFYVLKDTLLEENIYISTDKETNVFCITPTQAASLM